MGVAVLGGGISAKAKVEGEVWTHTHGHTHTQCPQWCLFQATGQWTMAANTPDVEKELLRL